MKILDNPAMFDHPDVYMFQNKDGCRLFHSTSQREVRKIDLQSSRCRQPLFIPALFRGRVNNRYHYKQEKSPHLGIEYIRAGSLAVRQEDHCFLLEPGDLFLLLPGDCNEVMTGPDGFCIKDSFQVRGELLDAYLESTGLNRRECIGDFDWKKFEETLTRLENSRRCPPAENGILAYELLQLLAYPTPSPSPEPEIVGLAAFMRENLEKNLRTETLMRQSGLSKRELNSKFRAVYGETPHQHLIGLRMKKAKQLLAEERGLSIKEIAQMTGWQNPLNFSSAFRKFTGTGPREFREAVRR